MPEPKVTPRDQICYSRFTPDLLLVWLFFTCVHWEQCLARGVLHRGIHKSGVFSTVSWAIRVPIVAVGAPNLSALHCIGFLTACPAVRLVKHKISFFLRVESVHLLQLGQSQCCAGGVHGESGPVGYKQGGCCAHAPPTREQI